MLSLPSPDSAVWFLLVVLAVWRVTSLLCYEEGPFRIATRFRGWLVRVGLGGVITRFHCSALWVSIVVGAVLFEWTARAPVAIVAAAGAVSIIERWLGGRRVEEEEES